MKKKYLKQLGVILLIGCIALQKPLMVFAENDDEVEMLFADDSDERLDLDDEGQNIDIVADDIQDIGSSEDVENDLQDDESVNTSADIDLFTSEEDNVELKVTGQPSDYTGKAGETAAFSIKAEGKNLKYQWQYSKDGGKNWTSFQTSARPSAVKADFKWVIEERFNGWICRCKVTDGTGNSTFSETARMTVKKEEDVELKITSQPSDYTGKAGETAAFSIKAEGKNLKYQWQYSKDGGKNWTSFQTSARPSAVKADFKWVIEERFNGWICRCKVTDGTGNSTFSETARMTVKKEEDVELKITSQPSDYTGKAGETATFSVKAEGKNLKYQWQYSKDGGKNWTSFQTSARPSAAKANFQWVIADRFNNWICRCQITDESGNSVITGTAKMIVRKDTTTLKITQQPTDVTAKDGEAFKIQIKAEGTGLQYTWLYRMKESNRWEVFYNESGTGFETRSTLSRKMQTTWDGLSIKCRIEDEYDNFIESEVVTLQLDVTPEKPTWVLKDGVLTFYGEIKTDEIKEKDTVEKVVIDGATKIPDEAFYNWNNLRDVNIGGSVEVIGSSAFSDCKNLETVTLSEGLKEIYGHAFRNDYKLEKIDIPYGVTSIGGWAFGDCVHLKKVKLPETITSMRSAFAGQTRIQTVGPAGGGYDLEYSWQNNISDSQIPSNAFAQMSNLESAVIEGVESVGVYAFANCTRLHEVSVGNKIKYIFSGAFYECKLLYSVSLSADVIDIGPYEVFDGCSSKLVLYCPKNSYAMNWAKENGIKYECK